MCQRNPRFANKQTKDKREKLISKNPKANDVIPR